ncbi:MAG: AmmeMemoRadiSam system protein B [Formivibrio sp.]|nr:AmmeMemoRadiSam system protein B [Formivibrio sp.]
MTTIRPAAVSGYFYASDPTELSDQIQHLLAQAHHHQPTDAPKALIVPHAGYSYSGPVAAAAYHALYPWADRIRRVVLLGPSHRIAVNGLVLPDVEAFETPLGIVPLDLEFCARLARLPQVHTLAACHASEHSLEVQLPFLQSVLHDFKLVPLIVGLASAQDVADVLEFSWGGPETLIVVSSDLSHYLSYDQALARDTDTLQRIVSTNNHIGDQDACGCTPIRGLLLLAHELGLKGELLDYRNSGDTTGDKTRVVGYGAVTFMEEA